MNDLRTIHLSSVAELRSQATAWDDLWWRSDVEQPTARAELLAQWIERFAPKSKFHVVVVVDQNRWIAALPLIGRRIGWMIPVGSMPGNSWSSAGELLLDAADDANAEAAAELLLAEAAQMPWQLLWLDEVRPETPRWQSLLRATEAEAFSACYREHFRVGRVEIDGQWSEYQATLPKRHRQGLNRALRRLGCEGEVGFEMNAHVEANDIEPWLREAFAVEDRSWKGAAGTSVIRTPGLLDFFLRQARQLSKWNQLQTAALRLDQRMLAFVYGFRSKGVFFVQKIGYDPQFAAFSPGQLLFNHILERLHTDGETRALDFMGPLAEWQSRWQPTSYSVGRAVMAPRRMLGSAVLYLYRNCRRLKENTNTAARDINRRDAETPRSEKGIERFLFHQK